MVTNRSTRVPASFLAKIARDPASRVHGAPPGFGQEVLPHIFSVAGRVGTVSKSYPWYDEALRDSRANAEIMRTETGIMECLEARKRGTALLKWHVEPRDTKDEASKDLASKVTMILEETRRFLDLRNSLMEAIWYGRYLTSHRLGCDRINGVWRQWICDWTPRHGDKIVFRYDDGSAEYMRNQIGLRMTMAYDWQEAEIDYLGYKRHKIETTSQFGRVYWLDAYERNRVALHQHMIEDGDYYNPRDLGRVNGVGIRDRVYWTWYMMQETLANALDYIERNSHGIEIWRFPAGNPEAERRTIEAAQNRSNKAVLLVPVQPGELADLQTVEVIEPGFQGLEALMGLITTFFSHKIKRYILGQVLTSEAAATGLGSGVADAHMATYSDIIRFDAMKLEECVTTDIVRSVQLWNFPDSRDVKLLFRLDTEAEDMESKLGAWKQAYDMGAKIPSLDLLGLIGARMPDEEEEFLQNMALDTEVQAAQLGQQMQAQAQQQQAMQQQNDPAIQRGANGNPQPGQPGGQRLPSTTSTFGPMGTMDGGEKSKHSITSADVDAAAKAAHPDPSDPQREAGNYQMGHIWWNGLDITIETPKGQRRKPQWPPMAAHYGYFKGTRDKDGDHVDVFIGEHPSVEVVFVLDQHKGPLSRRFDEHKVFIGFKNEHQAMQAYRASYDRAPGGPVTALTVPAFKAWLEEGNQEERIAPQVSKFAAKWQESLHPRKRDGKFAPKGQGEGGKPASNGKPQMATRGQASGARDLDVFKKHLQRKLPRNEDQRDALFALFHHLGKQKPLANFNSIVASEMHPTDRQALQKTIAEQQGSADRGLANLKSTPKPKPGVVEHPAVGKFKANLRTDIQRNERQQQALANVIAHMEDPNEWVLSVSTKQYRRMHRADRRAWKKATFPERLKHRILRYGISIATTAITQYILSQKHDKENRSFGAKRAAQVMGEETVRAVDQFFDGMDDGEIAQLQVPMEIWNDKSAGRAERAKMINREIYKAYLEVKFGPRNVKWAGIDPNGNLCFQVRKRGTRAPNYDRPREQSPSAPALRGLPQPAGATP